MESSFRYQIQWRMLIREKGNTFFLTTKPASNQPKIKTPDAWVPGVRAPSRLALAEGVQPQHGDDATTQTRKSHPPLSLALQSPPNSPLPLARVARASNAQVRITPGHSRFPWIHPLVDPIASFPGAEPCILSPDFAAIRLWLTGV